jgi:hypothetical protein
LAEGGNDDTVRALLNQAQKGMMMGKTAKKPKATKSKKAEPKTRVAIPWGKLKQLWDAGKSYLEMAKATDPHFDPNKPDATKTTRAKISIAMNKGVMIDGKLVRFKRRERTKSSVVGKKASKDKGKANSTKAKAVKISTVKTVKKGKQVKPAEAVKAAEPQPATTS